MQQRCETGFMFITSKGYSQSISFTSLLSKNQSPTASAMVYSADSTLDHEQNIEEVNQEDWRNTDTFMDHPSAHS
uniref:Uncharacterized protein n=2 Tax=Oryza TaxID=4527 RepID=A0A0E0H8J1_ORYNI